MLWAGRSIVFIAISFVLSSVSIAAEDRKSVYIFGVRAGMAGFTPPPGFYASSFTYFYSGEERSKGLKLDATAVLDVVSLLWVSEEKLMGGRFGFGVYAPLGYQRVAADISASGLRAGPWNSVRNEARAFGDPLALAFIGWQAGSFHMKLSAMLNVPVGDYSSKRIANIGLNRWAGDVTASVTWLDPSSRFEFSISPGFTFNGENPATNYKTGTEFHVESALMLHMTPALSLGIAGYHYQQISADTGSGAVFGPLKGQVSAIGPNVSYNFKAGATPVYASFRWLREFSARNRLQGNVGFLTLTVPFVN